jgi:hypothetical protein
MHVKIGYSIDLEDVPSRVAALMEEIKEVIERDIPQKFRVATHTLKESEDYSEAIDKMNKLRESLYAVDLRMADCTSILIGYQEASAQATPDDIEPTTPEVHIPSGAIDPAIEAAHSAAPAPVIDESEVSRDQAQEVIDKFKEQMGEYTKNYIPPAGDPQVPANPEEQAAAAMSMFQDMLNKQQ